MKPFASLLKRRSVTAAVALLVAFGAGVLMQYILVDRTPLATLREIPAIGPLLRRAEAPPELPTPPAGTLVPVLPPAPLFPGRVENPGPLPPEVQDDTRLSPFGFDCEPELKLTALEAAMIEAQLTAPCDQGQSVVFRHGPLELELATDAFGRAKTVLPGLETLSYVEAVLERQTINASLPVADSRSYSRVIMMWDGPQVFQINAYELGATRSESGHVSGETPKTASRAARGTGGFLVSLGDGTGRSAEVYSFPTGYSPLRGVVELIVEAEVTETSCGRLSEALTLQSNPLGGMFRTDVRVTLPSCERVGEVMELKNLLQDMRLAGR